MPYARKRVYRKRTSARPSRPKRSYRKARKVRPPLRLSMKPEIKATQVYFPMDGTTYEPTTTFNTVYPSSGNFNNLVGTTPGQGTARNQRIGDAFTRIGYNVDLYVDCLDNNIDCRFVLFEWLEKDSPDVAIWPNPLTPGQGWNPWFPAKSNVHAKVLYQKAWRTKIEYSGLGTTTASQQNVHRMHIKKFVKQRRFVSLIDQPGTGGYPATISATTSTVANSYKNRIYWCVLSNNIADADMRIFGYCAQYFIDS